MNQITKMIMMECITNLHVGDGDINYNIVDNEVQKDAITKLPTIHSSGVKGAFRAYFESFSEKNKNDHTDIFGSSPNEKEEENKKPGGLKFFSADCFALAMRNSKMDANCPYPFSLVTTKNILQNMSDLMNIFGITNAAKQIESALSSLKSSSNVTYTKGLTAIEGEKVQYVSQPNEFNEFFSDYVKCSSTNQVAFLGSEFMSKYQLPVNARNQLEKMVSKNLWYEEFVPHHSVFYTFVRGEDSLVNRFIEVIDGKVVQFGANTSIGFGLMKLSVVKG